MSYELQWLRQRVEELDASVRQARWHMDEVGQCRAELVPVWNDQCADEMARRFLEPWNGDATASLEALGLQIRELHGGIAALDAAEESAAQAEETAREVQRFAGELRTALHALENVLQQADSHAANTDSLVQATSHALALAEEAGNAA